MKAKDFLYGEHCLSEFGMILCRFDSNGGFETVSDGSEITFNVVPVQNGQKHELTSVQFESCLETTLQICKFSCKGDIQEITATEHRQLTKWLCRKKFLKLKILDENSIDVYCEAIINAKKIELEGRLYGLELDVFTNRPHMLKEPKTLVINATSEYVWNKYSIERKYHVIKTYLGTTKPSDMIDITEMIPRKEYEISKDGYFILGDYIGGSSDDGGYCYMAGQTVNPKSIYMYNINYDFNLNKYIYDYYLLTLTYEDSESEKKELIEDVSARIMNTYPSDGIQGDYWYVYAGVKTEHKRQHSINDESYEEGYIYPHTEITIGKNGNLNIYNAMEDRNTEIKNCVAGEVITMDYPVIQSSVSSHNIQNDFNWNFFRVANTYEESRNDLTISLPCTIKVKYSPIVKVGL